MTYDPSTRSNRELLTDWAGIMRVLREREIIRTNNSPTGDIAEALVERALGGKRSHFSNLDGTSGFHRPTSTPAANESR